MRITFVNQYDRHGGAERCLQDLCGGYRKRGHEVAVVVGKSTEAAGPATGVEVLRPGRLEWLVQRGAHRLLGLTDTLLWSPLVRSVRHPAFTAADVVHFHNLHGGYFNLWALGQRTLNCIADQTRSIPGWNNDGQAWEQRHLKTST